MGEISVPVTYPIMFAEFITLAAPVDLLDDDDVDETAMLETERFIVAIDTTSDDGAYGLLRLSTGQWLPFTERMRTEQRLVFPAAPRGTPDRRYRPADECIGFRQNTRDGARFDPWSRLARCVPAGTERAGLGRGHTV